MASLGKEISYPEPIDASMLAGGFVVLVTALGLTDRLAARIPPPVVLGLLASAIISLVVGILLNALRKITQGPLLLGRMFALTIALSGIHSRTLATISGPRSAVKSLTI